MTSSGVALGLLSALAFVAPLLASGPYRCAQGCLCDGKTVSCGGRHYFNSVPEVLPLDMEVLSITDCDIRELDSDSFARYKSLRRLTVMRTRLQSIKQNAFRGMEKIERLTIAENHWLGHLEPGAFAYLNNSVQKQLILQRSQIRSLSPDLFKDSKNFRIIEFRENPIEDIQPFAFRNLYYVDFFYLHNVSRISSDAFNGVVRVHKLTIHGWEVKKETMPNTFRGLRRVKYLRIEVSNLARVVRDTFAGLQTVEVVSFYNVMFNYLQAPSFSYIKNVRLILLDYSYVSHADQTLRPLIQHGLLRLSNSRVRCECHNLWLLSRDNGMTIAGLRNTTCVGTAWEGHSVWEVRFEYLATCQGREVADAAWQRYERARARKAKAKARKRKRSLVASQASNGAGCKTATVLAFTFFVRW